MTEAKSHSGDPVLDADTIGRLPSPAPASTQKFTTVELGDWIDLCIRAGVPHIPAERVATASSLALYEHCEPLDTPPPPDVIAFWKALNEFRQAHPTGYMLRWSCCAMSDVKFHLSKGRPEWRPEFMELHVDDFRAFDIIAEHPWPELSAWGRPWVEIEKLGGYPIEYRAFVIDDEIVGVSNYYPQRALSLTVERQIDINRVYELTRMLVTAQALPINCPQARELDLTRNQFTADFVRLADGSISFLEGGPPHTPKFGAHPCCFVAGEIGGVALIDRNPKRV